jgi:hypothetical protein
LKIESAWAVVPTWFFKKSRQPHTKSIKNKQKGAPMKKVKIATITLTGILYLGVSQASGALLGTTYLGGEYEFTKLNDMPAGKDDGLNMYGVVARSAVLDYLDIVSTGAFGGTDDTDISAVSFGVQPYFPLSNDKLKILGDFQVLWEDIDGTFRSDDDFGYSVGGGAEFDFSDKLSIMGVASYYDILDNDDITVSAIASFWITEQILVEGGAGYAIDAEDISVNLGLAFGF